MSGTTDKIASDILTINSWQLEPALDYYFTNRHRYTASNTTQQNKCDKSLIESIYNKYSQNTEQLSDDNLLSYFQDISIDASSINTLYLAYLFKCKLFGIFTRTEFIDGWYNYSCDSIRKMKLFVSSSDIIKQFETDHKLFKEFYRWLFDYSKDEPDRKTMYVPYNTRN